MRTWYSSGSRRASSGTRRRHSARRCGLSTKRRSATPTGVRAARTRIRAIGSRRGTGPSARGPTRIPRRSAIATSTRVRREAIVRGPARSPAIDRGKPTRRADSSHRCRRAIGRPDRRSLAGHRRHFRTIDRGKPNQQDRAVSENRGATNLQVVRRAAIDRGAASHPALIVRGETRRPVDPGAVTGRRQGNRRTASVRGRRNRLAQRSDRGRESPVAAKNARGPGNLRARRNGPGPGRPRVRRSGRGTESRPRMGNGRGALDRQVRTSGPGPASRPQTASVRGTPGRLVENSSAHGVGSRAPIAPGQASLRASGRAERRGPMRASGATTSLMVTDTGNPSE
jgi:hypothetical protein